MNLSQSFLKLDRASFPKLSAALMTLTLLFILVNAVIFLESHQVDSDAPYASKGTLELTQSDLSEFRFIPLRGEWRFVWQSLLTGEQSLIDQPGAGFMKIPEVWGTSEFNGQVINNLGFGTYQLTITVKQNTELLAVQLPSIGTAYTLYIDEKLVAEGGQVGQDASSSIPGYHPTIYTFMPEKASFTLTLQVSNHHLLWGGVWQPPRLGLARSIRQDFYQSSIRTIFLASFLITAAIFNLMQFLLRTSDASPLLIAATCVLIALREIETSQILFLSELASWDFDTTIRINFLTFFATAPALIGYFHLNYPDEYNKKLMLLLYVLSGLLILLVLFTPPLWFSSIMPWYQWGILGVMAYVIIGLVKATLNRRANAGFLSTGALILFFLIVNDILHSLNVISSAPLVSYGLAAFIMCQTYIIYVKFIDASFENQWLDTLAHQDPLTGLTNRRGTDQSLSVSHEQLLKNRTPYCILIIDFDQFKQLNDAHGHDVGDSVLIEGAKVMQAVTRDGDVVARWGGEEFFVLAPHTRLSSAARLSEKIRGMIKQSLQEKLKLDVTVTIGLAQARVQETAEANIKRADNALYRGKEQGRNQVVIAE